MGLATVLSRAADSIEAPQVLCEVNLSQGLALSAIVAPTETAVRESKDRVRAAIKNSEFNLPSWRITVSLALADLPIAVGVLAASIQVDGGDLEYWEFLAELSLTGRLRAIKGALPAIRRKLVLPRANAEEAGLVRDAEIYLAESLCKVAQALKGQQNLQRADRVADFTGVALGGDGQPQSWTSILMSIPTRSRTESAGCIDSRRSPINGLSECGAHFSCPRLLDHRPPARMHRQVR